MGSPYVPLPDLQQQQPNYLQTLGQVWAVRERRALANEHAVDTAKKQRELQVQQKIDQAFQPPTPSLINRSTGQPVQQQDPTQQLTGITSRLRAIGTPEAFQKADDLEKAFTAHQTAQAELQKQQQGIQDYHIGQAATRFQAAADAPPQMAQNAWTAAVKYATENGLDPDGHLSPIYDPEQAKYYSQLGMTAVQQITQKREAEQLALQRQIAGESARHNLSTEQQAAQTAAETAKYHGVEARQRQQQIGIEGGRLALERQRFGFDQNLATSGLKGEDFLKVIPEGQRNTVRSIANGDIAMPSSRSGSGSQLRNLVMQYDPTYTDARYVTKQNFKEKGDAQSMTQLATSLEHLENATKNSAKIGWAPALGTRAESGSSAAYEKDIQLFTQEAGKLVKNGVLGVEEYRDLLRGLDSSRQSVRDSALKELTSLMGGKVSGLFQKYKTGTGQELQVQEFFDKPTQERLQRYGIVEQPAAQPQHWSDQSPAGLKQKGGKFKWDDFPEQK